MFKRSRYSAFFKLRIFKLLGGRKLKEYPFISLTSYLNLLCSISVLLQPLLNYLWWQDTHYLTNTLIPVLHNLDASAPGLNCLILWMYLCLQASEKLFALWSHSLTGQENHGFSVCPPFSCKEENDKFQGLTHNNKRTNLSPSKDEGM